MSLPSCLSNTVYCIVIFLCFMNHDVRRLETALGNRILAGTSGLHAAGIDCPYEEGGGRARRSYSEAPEREAPLQ